MSTCGCLTVFAKTRHAAKRLSANPKDHASQPLAVTAKSIAAISATAIIAGALIGLATRLGQQSENELLLRACGDAFANDVRTPEFRMTKNARGLRCWSETTGSAKCAASSAIANTY